MVYIGLAIGAAAPASYSTWRNEALALFPSKDSANRSSTAGDNQDQVVTVGPTGAIDNTLEHGVDRPKLAP